MTGSTSLRSRAVDRLLASGMSATCVDAYVNALERAVDFADGGETFDTLENYRALLSGGFPDQQATVLIELLKQMINRRADRVMFG